MGKEPTLDEILAESLPESFLNTVTEEIEVRVKEWLELRLVEIIGRSRAGQGEGVKALLEVCQEWPQKKIEIAEYVAKHCNCKK